MILRSDGGGNDRYHFARDRSHLSKSGLCFTAEYPATAVLVGFPEDWLFLRETLECGTKPSSKQGAAFLSYSMIKSPLTKDKLQVYLRESWQCLHS